MEKKGKNKYKWVFDCSNMNPTAKELMVYGYAISLENCMFAVTLLTRIVDVNIMLHRTMEVPGVEAFIELFEAIKPLYEWLHKWTEILNSYHPKNGKNEA